MPAHYLDIPLRELTPLYHKGYLYSLLAKKFNCSTGTIANRLSEVKKRKLACKINLVEAKRLYLELKLSTATVAHIIGCDPSTVKRLLKESGVKMRTKSEGLRLYHQNNKLYSHSKSSH